jgi:hypothetical protein
VITQVGVVIIFWMHRWITKLQTGLVTICAWTKRVRHAGVWMEFEAYLERRFGLRVTHGMSEEVAEQFLQDITRLEKEDEEKRPGGA